MSNRTLTCIATLLLAFFSVAYAAGQSLCTDDNETTDEARHEIDNYDFLYYDSYYNYDVASIDDIMDEAFSHLGTRYRRGSKGPSAFDCSGFTSYVFGRMDINIGCSSRDQYAKNTPISREELQRGDLVFFSSPRSGRGVGHVGIVVDVDRTKGTFSFIHASSKGGVTVSESTDGYYTRRYIGARRVM